MSKNEKKLILCDYPDKFYNCKTCGEPCGPEGHFIETALQKEIDELLGLTHVDEHKQETPEEAAQDYLDRTYNLSYERTTWQKLHEKTFVAGAEWQKEKMVSKASYEDALSMQRTSNLGYESKIRELEDQIELIHDITSKLVDIIQWYDDNSSVRPDTEMFSLFEQIKKKQK
jgi:hypothetical protein